MNQITEAKAGRITPEMEQVAHDESLAPEIIAERVATGQVVIPSNRSHRLPRPIGIGTGLRTKVNANIGTSPEHINLKEEIEKVKVAIGAGADAIMDLSTGGDLNEIRREILKSCTVPMGTVPVYQAATESIVEAGAVVKMTQEKLFEVIERQAQDGVDFVTLHCGVTQNTLERLKRQGRVTDIVSRGGAFLTTWMIGNDKENPLYEEYDRVLDIAKRYDLTLSLGDGLRPGSLADATDRAQIGELVLLGELAQRAWEEDVQVMIEGPGHIPLNQIESNVLLEKSLCRGAPFYVLGPVVTDIAPGYDHITSAIGGAWAAAAGADFLCYVTRGEHLRLPEPDDVREGVVVTRIAAHAADIAKGIKRAAQWDRQMAQARKDLNWEEQIRLSVDPDLARKMRETSNPQPSDVCTMCGKYCALKLVKEALHPEHGETVCEKEK